MADISGNLLVVMVRKSSAWPMGFALKMRSRIHHKSSTQAAPSPLRLLRLWVIRTRKRHGAQAKWPRKVLFRVLALRFRATVFGFTTYPDAYKMVPNPLLL